MTTESYIQSIQNFLPFDIIPLILQGVIIYIAFLWIAVIIWVTKDVNNRSTSLIFQVISILLVILFTPLLGLFLYLIIRPAKTVTEKYREEQECNRLNEGGKKEIPKKKEKEKNMDFSEN